MHKTIQSGVIIGAIFLFMGDRAQSSDANSPPSPAVKAAVESTIKACEVKYEKVKALGGEAGC